MEQALIINKDIRAHRLKTWKPYYQALADRKKKFELRKMDRDFRVGDTLILQEYDNENKMYTGRELEAIIDFMIIGGKFGVQDDYCCMSLTIMNPYSH